MLTKTQIALGALLIAAFATPSFAQDYRSDAQYTVKHERSYAAHSPRLIEGRNAIVFGDISGTSTGRDAMVQTPGN
jgi:hypothetical protein